MAMAAMTASGWTRTDRPRMNGWSTCDSSCWTPMTTASMISAVTGPCATSAMMTATAPLSSAPTMGMNDSRNTSTPMARANGTRRISAPAVMPTASTAATSTVARV